MYPNKECNSIMQLLKSKATMNTIWILSGLRLLSLLIVFSLHPFLSFSSTSKIDSLSNILSREKNPLERSNLHIEIANYYWTINKDSSITHLNSANKILSEFGNKEKQTEILQLISSFYVDLGSYDQALETLYQANELTTENTDLLVRGKILGNIANCFSLKNNKRRAIEYYKEALVFIESSGSEADIAVFWGRFGNLYYINESYNEAIEYYVKAQKLFNKQQRVQAEATSLMNIGNCYKQLNVQDSALYYYHRSLKIFKDIGSHLFNEAQCLANIGNTHFIKRNFNEAQKYLLSADSLFSKSGNVYSIALVNRDLAYLYLELNKLKEAKRRIDKCFSIAQEYGYDYLIMTCNRLYWKYFEKTSDIPEAYFWLEKYMVIKDSIYSQERQANIDMLLAQFETEQKEKEIQILRQKEQINNLEIKRKTTLQYFTFFVLIAALLIITILYNNIQKRKRTNQLLLYQNSEISQQKEEIIAQRDEIESQRDLLQSQNSKLELFRNNTTQSLRYAQSIQAALLPSEKILQQISSDYFVLMKPCELVSGDFFWATAFDHYQVFCVADCTGHGVPGAFMSILGITALNDIVVKHRITKPNEILGYLRQSVIETLSQNDSEHHHKDGMDIALCVFDIKNRELQFAGAGISLLIVDESNSTILNIECNTGISNDNNCLFEIKPDIMPVGQSPLIKPFSNNSFKLGPKNLSLYLATDGYADQLSEYTSTKFGQKRLKSLILENSHLSFKDQHQLFNEKFDDWKGTNYQVDDVAIIGIRI